MKVTQWFDGNIKPVYIGMYQRDLDLPLPSYSYWNGKKWSCCYPTIEAAFDFQYTITAYPNLKWRGVAK